MCTVATVAIVDKNSFWRIAPSPKRPDRIDSCLISWIEQGYGVLAYSTEGGYLEELADNERILRFFVEWRRQPIVRLIATCKLDGARAKLRHVEIRSNDRHVLELALASEALVLCSEDKKLQEDFVDTQILPRIDSRSRKVYPHEKSQEDRREFLRQYQCQHCSDS